MTDAERRLRETIERAESFHAEGVSIETVGGRAVLDDLDRRRREVERLKAESHVVIESSVCPDHIARTIRLMQERAEQAESLAKRALDELVAWIEFAGHAPNSVADLLADPLVVRLRTEK